MPEKLEAWILYKLARNGYWGRRLINFDDLLHHRISRKELMQALKNLEKQRLIIKKKGSKSSAFRYSLVPNKKDKIFKILEEVCSKNGH